MPSDLLILFFELVPWPRRARLSSGSSLRASKEDVKVEVSIVVFT